MMRSIRLGLTALLALGTACQPAPKEETTPTSEAPAAAPAGLSADDERAVRAVDTDWARAVSAGDGNAVGALYSTDATLLPPMESIVQGEGAAKKYWLGVTKAFSAVAELATITVEGRGDLAYSVGTYRLTLTPKQPGAKALPTEEGKYVEVLKKQPDGSWKIAYDMWSANAPAKP